LAGLAVAGLLLASSAEAGLVDDVRAQLERGEPIDTDRLERAVADGGAQGVALAREVLQRQRAARKADARAWVAGSAPSRPIFNGLAHQSTLEAMDLLRAEVARRVVFSEMLRRDTIARQWGSVFRHRYGAAAFSQAAAEAADHSLSPLDRGLRLRVFSTLGRWGNRLEREFALETYRPYLRDPDVELVRAALSVNSALWDYEVVSDLVTIADGTDPFNRMQANHLVARALAYGPDRPPRGQSTLSDSFRRQHRAAYDPAGAADWAAHQGEWKREQRRLLGEEPAPPMPERPSVQLRPAEATPPQPPDGLPHRPAPQP